MRKAVFFFPMVEKERQNAGLLCTVEFSTLHITKFRNFRLIFTVDIVGRFYSLLVKCKVQGRIPLL